MSADATTPQGHGFGTTPVFLAGISTILGAIMFLRFGYAVGHTGLLGAFGIIVLGHLVTIPTALAIAEIATNRKVEGGGEYFIISRSFGLTIGSVIGIFLYLSQAISVAFYMIAFAEAFRPIEKDIVDLIGFEFDPRMISLPSMLGLLVLMLTKGADLGVKVLYVVVATLITSLILFFMGPALPGASTLDLTNKVSDPDGFFLVFAICFPAFTGMTAGVGLSGDLANPRRSIPQGTLLATITGFVVYLALVTKLSYAAPIDLLGTDNLIMEKIALWGPIIPIGLAAATISSAIGSILVAPRTLQAIGADGSFPSKPLNRWLAHGIGEANEPRNTTYVTGGLALAIVLLGNVDFVARLISMFFMVTYGALCAISFLEHFAARPSYRPSFRSRWYISLFGAIICLLMMFQMDPVFALIALAMMISLYIILSRRADQEQGDDLAAMFRGVLTQASRYLQIQLQRRDRSRPAEVDWRPSVIMVNARTFDRRAPLVLLRWFAHRYGFGTYLHFIQGHLDNKSYQESQRVKERLIRMASQQQSSVYMDTIVSPSMISALAQSLQVPGVSGLNNNALLFEFSHHDPPEVLSEVVRSCLFSAYTDMALMVLRHGDFHFGEHRNIHIWITWNDRENANLMIILGYILLDHPDWAEAEVTVFAALPDDQLEAEQAHFDALVKGGRMPIAEKNIRYMPINSLEGYRDLVNQFSEEADLIITGFSLTTLEEKREVTFTRHLTKRDILFVRAAHAIEME